MVPKFLAGICIAGLLGGVASEQAGPALPVVMDTLHTELLLRNAERLQKANYNPLYIGKACDSIVISDRWTDFSAYYVYGAAKSSLIKPDVSGVSIVIDTSRIVANAIPATDNSKQFKSLRYVRAYPVIITNTGGIRLNIGSGYHIPMIMEAVDLKGQWRPIEEPYIYKCGTGSNAIVLEPGHVAVTSVPVNNGPFKTRLRLRFNRILSHEFSGSIHPLQFESGFSIQR